jgi:hypothetical protein
MGDDSNAGDPMELSDGRQGPGLVAATAASSGPLLSRRGFIRGAVATGVAIGVGSMGYWGAGSRALLAASVQGTPPPSTASGSRTFRSRPDLSSPLISVITPGFRATAGQVFLTPATGPGPVVVDSTGSPMWIHPVSGKRAFNLRVGTYKGAPVLTWWEGAIANGTGQGEYVLMDESYAEVARVQAANGLQGDLHEFITTPEGTALFTAYAQQVPPVELFGSPQASAASPLLDSVVQEVDIASGRLLFEWRSSDHVSTSESYVGPSAGHPFDYFHVNSIDVATDGNLLVSARHTSTVYKIDRQTGAVIWRLGGKLSDFEMGPGTQFFWQHDARWQPDGSITLFDDGSNGSKPPNEDRSRGLILDVSESARRATLRQAYSHFSGILASSQGSMQPLPGGNVLVGWGDQPQFTEFAADGSVVLDARLPDGSTSYRALRFQWRGRPANNPAIAAERSDSGATTVYASWNGATEVGSWVVLGGDSPDALVPFGSGPRSGFETAIVLPARPRLVAVRALDAAGAVLAQSAAISA